MSALVTAHAGGMATDALHAVLEREMGRILSRRVEIVRLDRRPYEYATSHPLEELRVGLDDGTDLDLVAKDLSPRSLLHGARDAKPAFLSDPRREIAVYRGLLVRRSFAPACWGAEQIPALGRHWLFVEKVAGVELYQVGEPSTWQAVASWLAKMHSTFAGDSLVGGPRLLRYSDRFYRAWLRRAQLLVARNASLTPSESRRFERLALGYRRVVDALATLPVTLVHGDFYPSNILIPHESDAFDARAIDWEMAAAGPGLVDLAALTSGGWADDERTAMASAYRNGLRGPLPTPSVDEFTLQLSLCRLHLAVQWLGWSSGWSPPPEHEHDWLGEALRLAEIVGL